MTDPAGNNTTYSYSDSFFTDANPPANPPASYTPATPTNAYLTQATLPLSGTIKYGYYFNSGKRASSTEQNVNTTYLHFNDSFDRQTHTYGPLVNGSRGWILNQYSSSTLRDFYWLDRYHSLERMYGLPARSSGFG